MSHAASTGIMLKTERERCADPQDVNCRSTRSLCCGGWCAVSVHVLPERAPAEPSCCQSGMIRVLLSPGCPGVLVHPLHGIGLYRLLPPLDGEQTQGRGVETWAGGSQSSRRADNAPRQRGALQTGRHVHRIADGRVVQMLISADVAHNRLACMHADAVLQVSSDCLGGLPHGQRAREGQPGMVRLGQRSIPEGDNGVADVAVDRRLRVPQRGGGGPMVLQQQP